MNCKELLGSLSAYLDDETRMQICNEVERHLKYCPSCKVQVDTLSRTVSLVRDLGHGCCREELVIKLRTRIITRSE